MFCQGSATITAEQICAIIALACELPSDSGHPITHWSQQAVADEAVRRGIIETITGARRAIVTLASGDGGAASCVQ